MLRTSRRPRMPYPAPTSSRSAAADATSAMSITLRRVSRHTIASYRDTFRLLLGFAQHTTGKQPCQLDLTDLDAHSSRRS
jgi:hypothetical protein